MVDVIVWVALVIVALGVVGSVVPGLPGALLSLLGFYLYWWQTGFTDPGWLFAILYSLTGLVAFLADYVAGAVSAKVGGASGWTMAAAAAVGLFLMFFVGPVGVLLGVVLTVVAVEVYRGTELEEGIEAGLYAAAGMIGSALVQFVLTASMFVAVVIVVVY